MSIPALQQTAGLNGVARVHGSAAPPLLSFSVRRQRRMLVTAEFWHGALVVGLFAFGALAGLLSRWGPLSGWAALGFPLVLPPLGIGLTALFC